MNTAISVKRPIERAAKGLDDSREPALRAHGRNRAVGEPSEQLLDPVEPEKYPKHYPHGGIGRLRQECQE
jgi:hypothetical protein